MNSVARLAYLALSLGFGLVWSVPRHPIIHRLTYAHEDLKQTDKHPNTTTTDSIKQHQSHHDPSRTPPSQQHKDNEHWSPLLRPLTTDHLNAAQPQHAGPKRANAQKPASKGPQCSRVTLIPLDDSIRTTYLEENWHMPERPHPCTAARSIAICKWSLYMYVGRPFHRRHNITYAWVFRFIIKTMCVIQTRQYRAKSSNAATLHAHAQAP